MQGQENRLISYLIHGGCKYQLSQKGNELTLEIENSYGKKASVSVSGVDCSNFTPRLDPLSKSNTAQVVLSFKSIGGKYKSVVYSYNSGQGSLTEQGPGYTHPGQLLSINGCGPVNREKVCAVYNESGSTKVQVLSVNSDTGAIITSVAPKIINGLDKNVAAISATEGGGQRIVVLAKDGTGLKTGGSTGNSITMSPFTPTGGLSGEKVDKILLNACKDSRVCAVVTSLKGEVYYLKSNGDSISTTSTKIASYTGDSTSLSVDPEYGAGSTVSKFNVFVTGNGGSVTKASFEVIGNQCEKSNSATITEKIYTSQASVTTTEPTGSQTSVGTKLVTTSQATGNNSGNRATSTNRAVTSTSATTVETATSPSVRRKNTTPHTKPNSTTKGHHSTKKRATRAAKTVSPAVTHSTNPTFYPTTNVGLLSSTANPPRESTSSAVAPSSASTAGLAFGIIAGGVVCFLLLGFLYLVCLVCRRRARERRRLEIDRLALAMEAFNPSEGDYSDSEVNDILEDTNVDRHNPEKNNQR
ncbi:hypothetical protein [Neorickettsia sennetsu]|uniref:Uncharacterized protein n=1 Tax=Ehrlichia sennetsu (strain ATCC VR-367 / Miyayama) TaxID=222891 RepID=Q2GDQ1_EHRS3|nr:hypothetical protein [Neorickettsia sennetsu]ABD45729.1 hypothetical protein NSE_0511 [Neorickettsia sennetsu str. Miyayama]